MPCCWLLSQNQSESDLKADQLEKKRLLPVPWVPCNYLFHCNDPWLCAEWEPQTKFIRGGLPLSQEVQECCKWVVNLPTSKLVLATVEQQVWFWGCLNVGVGGSEEGNKCTCPTGGSITAWNEHPPPLTPLNFENTRKNPDLLEKPRGRTRI